MPKISQVPVPKPFVEVFKQSGIKIKQFKSPLGFERELKKFIKRNHVLHLATSKNGIARSTPLEYRSQGLTFFVLSEGGGKFENLKHSRKVSFSIAEPYNSEEGYWTYKGIQAWCTAKVYSRSKNPKQFAEAVKKMDLRKSLKNLGMKDLPPNINYRIIELDPDKIKYGNPTDGIFRVTWTKKG